MKKSEHSHTRKPNKTNSKPSPHKAKTGKGASARAIPIAPENSDNPKILELVNARGEVDRAKQAHRKFVWKMIAVANAIAAALMKDMESWREFCALDWGKLTGPKVEQRHQAFRFTLKFIFAKGKKGEKRASFYYNAVKALVEQGRHDKGLVKAIEKAGGLKKLQGQKSGRSKSAVNGASLLGESKITDDIDEPLEDDDDTDKACRRQVHEEKDDYDHRKSSPSKSSNSQTEMPFMLVFQDHPRNLTSSKLPVRIVIKGEVLSLGRTTTIKVDSHKLKKPKP
ncbi:hypothetical protein HGP17_18855 [Rhizobium sp. P38BS-XIX]|uniref:hypothetical protein n=1 Tax=Rhizobium sp. P38BS-XIX TaxID=2726740 RepID=UPI001456F438|nr:hypothetical protein [Rhizobium sp. P38BS-XIX]NLR98882.1 hypothetical protein [Rhizobium sp. P38BS-XIX]